MANPEHVEQLRQGGAHWNVYVRSKEPFIADFSGVDLSGSDLSGADLNSADLRGASLMNAILTGVCLTYARLFRVNLSGADLRNAGILGADLSRADLSGADLRNANILGSDLSWADLSGADLRGADLSFCRLVKVNFQQADLSGCIVYGISAWDLDLEGACQDNLVITQYDQPTITADSLEVAQFLYLMLNNKKLRHVIDTITSKVVLILGRFTPERKAVLDALRQALRGHNYLPVLFDFNGPDSQTVIETIGTLAHLARFVVADYTDPKVVLQEIQHIVEHLVVPIKPLMLKGPDREPLTLFNLRAGRTYLLPVFYYEDLNHLIASLDREVINPAEALSRGLTDSKLLSEHR